MHRGGHRARVLDADPPPPPPPLEIGRKVLDHRRQRRRKQVLLDVAKGKKKIFSPHVSSLNILGIFRRIQKWTKIWTFQLALNQYPISEHYFSEMATTLVGGALRLQLESPRVKSWCWQMVSHWGIVMVWGWTFPPLFPPYLIMKLLFQGSGGVATSDFGPFAKAIEAGD